MELCCGEVIVKWEAILLSAIEATLASMIVDVHVSDRRRSHQ